MPPERKVIMAEYPVCGVSGGLTVSFAVAWACMGSCRGLSVDARAPDPGSLLGALDPALLQAGL